MLRFKDTFDAIEAYVVWRWRLRRMSTSDRRWPRLVRRRGLLGLLALLALLVAPVVIVGQHLGLIGAVLAAPVIFLAIHHLLVVMVRRLLFHLPQHDVGSARTLQGTCTVLEIFVGTKWSRLRKKRTHQTLRSACAWLTQQARAHGVALDFRHERLPDLPWDHAFQQVSIRDLESDENRRVRQDMEASIERVVAAHLASSQAAPGSYFVVAHVEQDDVGYAVNASNSLNDRIDLEICVCSGSSLPGTYAHEILHLFGARDLYYYSWMSLLAGRIFDEAGEHQWLADQQMAIFRREFGGTVMARGRTPLDGLEVHPLTAHEVGWAVPRAVRRAAVRAYDRALIASCDAMFQER